MKKVIRLNWGDDETEVARQILNYLKEKGKAEKAQFGDRVTDNITLIVEIVED